LKGEITQIIFKISEKINRKNNNNNNNNNGV
jgi:hypothetical protein